MCAWRYTTPARRSGSWQRLAARVPRQAIYTAAALRVRLLVFLELWLGTHPMSCGSGWGLSTWYSLSCGSE
ncbi:hypothetical protein DEO72_LG1g3095 [Vigna unguiculata]|uniref:Uncharacterized protein n=1 Tax=Vigna unguiculata TaxID=3917 RepID=A0A4D6KZC5_VIGUN|nr:hypothetical protein DEO72_LG1g3095 [Vigna unguiculata]